MTPRASLIGTLVAAPVIRNTWLRRGIVVLLTLVLVLLSIFPERYRAASSLTPSDPASLGLSGALVQLGAVNSVFGNQAQVEIALKIGRSVYTRHVVIRNLNLVKRLGLKNEAEASRWMEREIEVRSLRGGIVQIECINRDQALATDLVKALTAALRQQLAQIALRQTGYKREILMKLVDDANMAFARAQNNYNGFRLKTRYTNPAYAIEAIGERIPVLQAAIKAKEVELDTARQFATDDNMAVRQVVAQIDSLKSQLRQFQALDGQEDNSIGSVVPRSTEAQRLERELSLAKSLYYNYRRFLEGTSVEDLTSAANIRVLEQPYIDTDRQYRLTPLGLATLLVLLALAIEFYRLRPPVGGSRED